MQGNGAVQYVHEKLKRHRFHDEGEFQCKRIKNEGLDNLISNSANSKSQKQKWTPTDARQPPVQCSTKTNIAVIPRPGMPRLQHIQYPGVNVRQNKKRIQLQKGFPTVTPQYPIQKLSNLSQISDSTNSKSQNQIPIRNSTKAKFAVIPRPGMPRQPDIERLGFNAWRQVDDNLQSKMPRAPLAKSKKVDGIPRPGNARLQGIQYPRIDIDHKDNQFFGKDHCPLWEPASDTTFKSDEFWLKRVLKKGPRHSHGPAWERGFQKYDPLTAPELSPIKPLPYNTMPRFFDKDALVIGYTWVLSMSDQFYYDNALSLLSQYMSSEASPDRAEKMARAIRNNYRPITVRHMSRFWRDIKVLGEGSFGVVYRITDSSSKLYLAVKYIKAMKQDCQFKDHTSKLIEYLHERNHLIQASKSEFVMQFKSSFSFPNISGIFLVFEWCICDLSVILKHIKDKLIGKVPPLSDMLLRNNPRANRVSFTQLYRFFSKFLNLDLNKVIVIYVFEMFCILDFLSGSNIIHRDIKPENVMVGQNFHLKLGDFGLVQNTRFITGSTQIYMVRPMDLSIHNKMEKEPFGPAGTPTYMDPEVLFYKFFWNSSNFKTGIWIMEMKRFLIDRVELPKLMETAEATFMTDVWAAGLVMSELLFLGNLFIDTDEWTPAAKATARLGGNNWIDNVMQIAIFKNTNQQVIQEGFVHAVCGDLNDKYNILGAEFRRLMTCVTSIFRARSLRCHEYRKIKEVTGVNGFTRRMHFIDMSRIEAIPIFWRRNLNARTVFTIPLKDEMAHLASSFFSEKKNPIVHKTVDKWFHQLQKKSPQTQFFPMKPGYQINFDNN